MVEGQYQCPACAKPLIRKESRQGLFWVCEGCFRCMVGLSVLKQTADHSFLNGLWLEAKSAQPGQGDPCPACSKPMATVMEKAGPPPLRFQICVLCETCWLSHEEWDTLPPLPAPVDDSDLSKLPPEAAKEVALTEFQILKEKAGPDEPEPALWEWLLSLLGLPTKPGDEVWVRFPWATAGVVLVTAGVSVFSFPQINAIAQDWGFMPAQWDRHGGLTLLSSFLLHANWEHLLGNMYFLLLFGVSIENKVGPLHFLAILFLSAGLGDALTYYHDPLSTDVGIGASGGIAGVMLFFAFAFPQREIFWGLISLPAVYAMGLWLVFQMIYAGIQVKGWEDGIGYFAHIGGALWGWVYWFVLRKKLGLDWKKPKSVFDL